MPKRAQLHYKAQMLCPLTATERATQFHFWDMTSVKSCKDRLHQSPSLKLQRSRFLSFEITFSAVFSVTLSFTLITLVTNSTNIFIQKY